MPADVKTSRTIALIVSAMGLFCACGLGPVRNAPPAPPPPAPVLSANPGDRLYFTAAPGTTSPSQTVTFTNISGQTLDVSPAVIRFNDDNLFAMETTCGDSLAPSASCVVTVSFHPVARLYTWRQSVSLCVRGSGQCRSVGLVGTNPSSPTAKPPQ